MAALLLGETDMSENRKRLEGVRLIELANYVAAPIVGRIAADLGAEVIKIEGAAAIPGV